MPPGDRLSTGGRHHRPTRGRRRWPTGTVNLRSTGRTAAACRSTAGRPPIDRRHRQPVDQRRPTSGRSAADRRHRAPADLRSTNSHTAGRPLIDRRATDGRPLVDRRSTTGRPSAVCRATAGRSAVDRRSASARPLAQHRSTTARPPLEHRPTAVDRRSTGRPPVDRRPTGGKAIEDSGEILDFTVNVAPSRTERTCVAQRRVVFVEHAGQASDSTVGALPRSAAGRLVGHRAGSTSNRSRACDSGAGRTCEPHWIHSRLTIWSHPRPKLQVGGRAGT